MIVVIAMKVRREIDDWRTSLVLRQRSRCHVKWSFFYNFTLFPEDLIKFICTIVICHRTLTPCVLVNEGKGDLSLLIPYHRSTTRDCLRMERSIILQLINSHITTKWDLLMKEWLFLHLSITSYWRKTLDPLRKEQSFLLHLIPSHKSKIGDRLRKDLSILI